MDTFKAEVVMKDRSEEAARCGEAELALGPTTEFIFEPIVEPIEATKTSPLMALNAFNRQLAKVNIALTALWAASERRETTTLMLEQFNSDWDVLDARLKILARAAVDHDQWIRQPVEQAYERLRRLLERGIVYGQEAAQEVSDPRAFLEQLRRLPNRLLIYWDRNQESRDESARGDDLIGRTIGGFVLGSRIGEGGHGAVYSCEQPLLEREVVVKVLHRELRRSRSIGQRFLREAKLAARLDHPYAAHVYAFGIEEDDSLLWIAMERVHGVTLADWLKLHGPMPLGQFVSFFERIAAVVQTAHERGIVHRDLKPANIMVIERAGEFLPKLLDFGVAKLLDNAALPAGINDPSLPVTDDSGSGPVRVLPPGKSTVADESVPLHRDDDRLTQSNHTIGSPPYISPEQWGNAMTVGPASDLYALAVVAFETLTGRRLFEAATMTDYATLHCLGEVPPLGGSFPPALDQMFQRALAKRPEDRWPTALELAGALRAASGIGATRSDLPRIDQDVRDAWFAEAPQPLAESMAKLDDAHNAYQARDIADELIRALLRYLLAMALAMSARAHHDRGDPVLLELVRALDRRKLSLEERAELLRLLVRRLTSPRHGLPVPELLDLLALNPDGTDELDAVLALHTATRHAVTEDAVRLQLMRLIPALTQLLRATTFVLGYVLVVPRNHAAERWTGLRRQPRVLASVAGGELVDGYPMLLDPTGRVCLDLWPLVQAVPPAAGAEPELFLFDGHGRHGALLIAASSGRKHHDSIACDWVATHVIAELENKTRMRDQLRGAAQQWQDRARPNGLLWRGDALADLERWMRETREADLSDLEASFLAASRRVARRSRWGHRLLVAAVVAIVLGVGEYRSVLNERMAEQATEQPTVEQVRGPAMLCPDEDTLPKNSSPLQVNCDDDRVNGDGRRSKRVGDR